MIYMCTLLPLGMREGIFLILFLKNNGNINIIKLTITGIKGNNVIPMDVTVLSVKATALVKRSI